MNNDALKRKAELESVLNPSDVDHLGACVQVVMNMKNQQTPTPDPVYKRYLIQFNRGLDLPPNARQEKVVRYGSHTFYAFKVGRDCQ